MFSANPEVVGTVRILFRVTKNAEIISRVERSLDVDNGLTALTDRVEELENIGAEQEKQIEQLFQWVDDLRVATHQYDPNGLINAP